MVFTEPDMELQYDVNCQERNRFRNILPYRQNRVKLLDAKNDYINASFVEVEELSRKYIVTQGPMQNTINHFWQMVWEQQSVGIVMLCKCEERGRDKCARYWPTMKSRPFFAGCYVVECMTNDWNDSYCITSLKLHDMVTGEARTILHFHYFSWPDFGIPQKPLMFLQFLMDVRGSGVMQPGVGPVIVHCSAGVGRSGVFCLTDVCMSWLEGARSLHTLDIKHLLVRIRKQRLGLIQTPEQLRFAYATVLNAAHFALELGQSISDLQNEVKYFIGTLREADEKYPKSKCVCLLPPAHSVPPSPLPMKSIPSTSSQSLPALLYPGAAMLEPTSSSPPHSPSPYPSLSSLYSIESYSSYTSSLSPPSTPAPPNYPRSSPSVALGVNSPEVSTVTASFPEDVKASTKLREAMMKNCERVKVKKTKRNWFLRLKERLFQRSD